MIFLLLFLLVPPMSMAGDVVPSETIVPMAPPPAPSPVSEDDKNRILRGIRQAAEKEQREFDQNEKQLRRDLVRSQNDRRKEWRENERKARRQYFETHTSGPERRAYVQEFVQRKKDFDYHEKVEWTEFRHRQKEARDTMVSAHRRRLKEAQESLKKGLVPSGI